MILTCIILRPSRLCNVLAIVPKFKNTTRPPPPLEILKTSYPLATVSEAIPLDGPQPQGCKNPGNINFNRPTGQ